MKNGKVWVLGIALLFGNYFTKGAVATNECVPALLKGLEAKHFTDSQILKDEIDRLFFNGWVWAGRAEDAPSPGQYFVGDIAGQSIIVVRNNKGELSAFYNVCSHRGAILCESNSGCFLGGGIRCPYHQWKYSLAGALLAAPGMSGVPGFDKKDYPLTKVAVEEWDGHVFVNLSKQRPQSTLASQLGFLVEKLKNWGMKDLRQGAQLRYEVKSNWKLIIQNYSECLHCPGVHPQLQKQSHYLSGKDDGDPSSKWVIGGNMDLKPGVQTLSMDGTTQRTILPGLNEDQRQRVYYYVVVPNVLLSLHPDYVMIHILFPRGVGETEVLNNFYFHPGDLKRQVSVQDAVDFWDITNRQDWHVSELAQKGVASRGYRPGPYSPFLELGSHETDQALKTPLKVVGSDPRD